MSKSIQLKDTNNEKMYPHPYYPVGSIYLSVSNTNPSKWFGGTWGLVAQGRTLIGVDTSQTEFNTVKKTGGSKTHLHSTGNCTLTVEQIPAHSHNITNDFYKYSYSYGVNGQVYKESGTPLQTNTISTHNTGGGKAHNHGNTGSSSNLPPYFTCYIWCRTA